MNQIRTLTKRTSSGFTLVEILVVIVIIGILAGISIPAITSALRTAKEAAIRTEIDVISQALVAYQQKHGDYPPDFSDWDAVERHFRKAFPSIDNNELKILAQFTWLQPQTSGTGYTRVVGPADPDPRTTATSPGGFRYHPHSMDRAEALVFCLGGYSSDKKKPFTGQGGPLALIPADSTVTPSYLRYQYNTDRNNGFIEMETDALSVRQFNLPGGPTANPIGTTATYTYSGDELDDSTLGSWVIATSFTPNAAGIPCYADPFPSYNIGRTELPLTYFNADQYVATFSNTPASGAIFPAFHYLNVFMPPGMSPAEGVARPYASEVVNTKSATPTLEFAENNRFQLISAGLDDSYGGIFSSSVGGTNSGGAVFVFRNGKAYNPFNFSGSGNSISAQDKFADDDIFKSEFGGTTSPYSNSKPQLDNITNFTTRTFESDLP